MTVITDQPPPGTRLRTFEDDIEEAVTLRVSIDKINQMYTLYNSFIALGDVFDWRDLDAVVLGTLGRLAINPDTYHALKKYVDRQTVRYECFLRIRRYLVGHMEPLIDVTPLDRSAADAAKGGA